MNSNQVLVQNPNFMCFVLFVCSYDKSSVCAECTWKPSACEHLTDGLREHWVAKQLLGELEGMKQQQRLAIRTLKWWREQARLRAHPHQETMPIPLKLGRAATGKWALIIHLSGNGNNWIGSNEKDQKNKWRR